MVAWTPAVLVAAWALVRLFGLESGYPAVAAMAYTPHVFPVAVLAAILATALRQWPAAGVAAAATLLLIFVLAPRVIGGPDGVEGRSVRVMTANVFRGEGDAAQLLEMGRERRVEVLAVQELTPEFARRFDQAGAGDLFPYRALAVRDGVIGSGVYSSHPVTDIGAGEFHFTQTRAQVAVGRGLSLDVVSVHAALPAGGGQTDEWAKALRQMPAPSRKGPVHMLLGDFNATVDQEEFRALLDGEYQDAGGRMGSGLIPTWPDSDRPWRLRFLPVTIDHVLYDGSRVGVSEYEVLDLVGSDHRSVFAELVVREDRD